MSLVLLPTMHHNIDIDFTHSYFLAHMHVALHGKSICDAFRQYFQNLGGSSGPKMTQNAPKIGKITIFPRLIELGY